MTTHSTRSYDEFRSTFRLEDLTARFAGNFEAGLNACYECCDRYAGSNKVALSWEDKEGRSATYTFDDLQVLSAHAYPREIEFIDTLPKTPSGKIQRFLLRQQEVDRAKPAQG